MWDENSNYPRFETGFAYKHHLNNQLLKKFKTGKFIERSAVLKLRF